MVPRMVCCARRGTSGISVCTADGGTVDFPLARAVAEAGATASARGASITSGAASPCARAGVGAWDGTATRSDLNTRKPTQMSASATTAPMISGTTCDLAGCRFDTTALGAATIGAVDCTTTGSRVAEPGGPIAPGCWVAPADRAVCSPRSHAWSSETSGRSCGLRLKHHAMSSRNAGDSPGGKTTAPASLSRPDGCRRASASHIVTPRAQTSFVADSPPSTAAPTVSLASFN